MKMSLILKGLIWCERSRNKEKIKRHGQWKGKVLPFGENTSYGFCPSAQQIPISSDFYRELETEACRRLRSPHHAPTPLLRPVNLWL